MLLVTADACAGAGWPWDSIAEHFHMPDLSRQPDITHAVSYLMRSRPIDRIVALDDYDVGTAAALRENLRLPGMGQTTVRHFRDKLAMRMQAADAGLRSLFKAMPTAVSTSWRRRRGSAGLTLTGWCRRPAASNCGRKRRGWSWPICAARSTNHPPPPGRRRADHLPGAAAAARLIRL